MTLTLLSIATLYHTSVLVSIMTLPCSSFFQSSVRVTWGLLKCSVTNLRICSRAVSNSIHFNVACLSTVGLLFWREFPHSSLTKPFLSTMEPIYSWAVLVWDEILMCLIIKFVCMCCGWRKHEISKRLEKFSSFRWSKSLTSWSQCPSC